MSTPEQSILLKCLSGKASPEEAALLDEWINRSPENRREFTQLWNLWQRTTGHPGYSAPDLSSEWNNLQTRIHTPAPQSASSGQSSPSGSTAPHVPFQRPSALNQASTFQQPSGLIIRALRTAGWKLITTLTAGLAVAGVIGVRLIRHSGPASSSSIARPAHISPLINTATNTGSAVFTDTLRDHTIVTLDVNSSISYMPQRLDDSPVTISGNVFLQTDRPSSHPLQVKMGELTVRLDKGKYFLSTDSSTGTWTIHIVKGNIHFISPRQPAAGSGSLTTLSEGQEMVYSGKDHTIKDALTTDKNSYGFATRDFDFKNAPLKTVITQLEKTYDIKIDLSNPSIANCRITTWFENKPIRYVMDVLTTTLNLSYSIEQNGRRIVISGQGCE